MSMHDMEYLVEDSIKVLDSCITDEIVDLRSICHKLYKWQGQWDTGFTNFRVIDILVKHRYSYQMDMTGHPNYKEFQPVLDQFVVDANQPGRSGHYPILFLDFLDPTRNSREETKDLSYQERTKWYQDNPTAAYYRYPYLYADAGSPLWKALVENGQLTGKDAELPHTDLTIIDIGNLAVRCAEKQDNHMLITYWYLCLPYYLIAEDQSKHVDNPALQEILDIIERTDALSKTPAIPQYLKAMSFDTYKTTGEYLERIFNFED